MQVSSVPMLTVRTETMEGSVSVERPDFRGPRAWSPNFTIGSRVVVDESADTLECELLRGGSCFTRAWIESVAARRAVGEVVRCSPKYTTVRFRHRTNSSGGSVASATAAAVAAMAASGSTMYFSQSSLSMDAWHANTASSGSTEPSRSASPPPPPAPFVPLSTTRIDAASEVATTTATTTTGAAQVVVAVVEPPNGDAKITVVSPQNEAARDDREIVPSTVIGGTSSLSRTSTPRVLCSDETVFTEVKITIPSHFLTALVGHILHIAGHLPTVQQLVDARRFVEVVEVVKEVVAYVQNPENRTASGAIRVPQAPPPASSTTTTAGLSSSAVPTANSATTTKSAPSALLSASSSRPKAPTTSTAVAEEERNAEARHVSLGLLCIARQILIPVQHLRPEAAALLCFSAKMYLHAARYDEALQCAGESIVLDPSSVEGYTVAASILLAVNDLDRATAVIDAGAAVARDQSPELAHIGLAVRVSRFFSPRTRPFGIEVVPLSHRELLHCAAMLSPAASRAQALVAEGRADVSLQAVGECLGITDGLRFPSHLTLRCVSLRNVPALPELRVEDHPSPSSSSHPYAAGQIAVPEPRDGLAPTGAGRSIVFEEHVPVLLCAVATRSGGHAAGMATRAAASDGNFWSAEEVHNPSPVSIVAGTAAAGSAAPPPFTFVDGNAVCGFCGFSLTPHELVVNAAAQLHRRLGDIVSAKFPARNPVCCTAKGCRQRYCSEVCRAKAATLFHFLECAGDYHAAQPNSINNNGGSCAESGGHGAESSSSPFGSPRRRATVISPTGSSGSPTNLLHPSPPLLAPATRAQRASILMPDVSMPFSSATPPASYLTVRAGEGGMSTDTAASQIEINVDDLAASLSFAPRRWSADTRGADQQSDSPRRSSMAFEREGSGLILSNSQSAVGAGGGGTLNASGSPSAASSRRVSRIQIASRLQVARRNSVNSRDSSDVAAVIRRELQQLLVEIRDNEFAGGLSPPAVVRNGVAVFVRCISTMLSLFFDCENRGHGTPRNGAKSANGAAAASTTAPSITVEQRNKRTIMLAVVQACEERGLSSSGCDTPADKRDPAGLVVAEELLQRLGIPFFFSHSPYRPSWQDLAPPPTAALQLQAARRGSLSVTMAASAGTSRPGRAAASGLPSAATTSAATDGASTCSAPGNASLPLAPDVAAKIIGRLEEALQLISRIMTMAMSDATVAISASVRSRSGSSSPTAAGGRRQRSDSGSSTASPLSPLTQARRQSTVFDIDDDKLVETIASMSDEEQPSVWTVGRIFRFLSAKPFVRQLWTLCLTSHTLLTVSHPAAAVGPHLPEHLQKPWLTYCASECRYLLVLSPLASVTTDWTTDTAVAWCSPGTGTPPLPPRFVESTTGLMVFAGLKGSQGALSLSSGIESADQSSRDFSVASQTETPRHADDNSSGGRTSYPEAQPRRTTMLEHTMELVMSQPLIALKEGNTFLDPYHPYLGTPGERKLAFTSLTGLHSGDVIRCMCSAQDVAVPSSM